MSPKHPLPTKENALFKKILKCYEHKQYKNGLKFAKQILSNPKHAEHGETLAMKGLTLNCLGRKEEAYEYVRRGLRNDLTSHVCWHVYGLLQRSDHKYDEAIKCYRNALKWDKDNIQILRDLSLLQIQMRDLEGYRDTRYQLFILRPAQRASWIGFAMAYHLLTDYDTACKILEEFRKTTAPQNQKSLHNNSQQKGANENYEHSELLLYQVMVMKDAGNYQEALNHLDKHLESEICDKLSVHENKSELLILLGRLKEARKVIKDCLIARNSDNIKYYKLLERAMDLTEDQENERLKLYFEFQQHYPRSQMPFRIPLNFISDLDLFKGMLDSYFRKGIRKGQPALFRDIRSIYNDLCGGSRHASPLKLSKLPDKVEIIQSLMLSYIDNLIKYDSFDSTESTWGSEPATCLLWVYYYLAQHYDYLGDLDEAFRYVNIALEHTPTLIELFVTKAKICKHAGNIEEAIRCMDEAQSLDTADRYLNSKCAKYLLRGNKITEAEEMCSKFTREGVSASENLNEMQCMWFQSESALSYQRLEKWGEALKKCHEIDRHFAEINEDQFDFHTYCMRKMTLRSYIELLRLEDVLKAHPFYFVAAKTAIEIYLRLFDKPLSDLEESEENNVSNMSASELKKLRNKQRKAKMREKAASTNVNESQNQQNADKDKNKDDAGFLHQEPLDSYKLERPEDPLGEAIKFLRPLQLLAHKRIETHLLAFEIYYRKGKIMLMLQSLKRAIKIDSNHFTFQKQLVLFFNWVSEHAETLDESLKQVINLEMKKLIEDDQQKINSASQLNEKLLQMNHNSFAHRIESSKIKYLLEKSSSNKKKSMNNVNSDSNSTQTAPTAINIDVITDRLEELENVDIDRCVQLMKSMKIGEFGAIEEIKIEELKSKCHKIFPYATSFMSQEDESKNSLSNHNINSNLVSHNNDCSNDSIDIAYSDAIN